MKILFPNHPLKGRLPDPDYEAEFEAAREAGFECELYCFDDLRACEFAQSIQYCKSSAVNGERMLHRGWMMPGHFYAALRVAILSKGYCEMVSTAEYEEAHYLPNAYPLLQGRTPESVWVEGKDSAAAWLKYEELGRPAAIVKDFVKSAKHRWNEACFIPAGTGRGRFEEILKAFLEVRGELFEKGIVLRRFHELMKLADDIRGQPVHEEYRLFMWRGKLLAATPSIFGPGPLEKLNDWESIAQRFKSPFISMDIARQADGSWIIIEVGDGGVSGLPESIEARSFYKALYERVK
jgi:hypothetical protein